MSNNDFTPFAQWFIDYKLRYVLMLVYLFLLPVMLIVHLTGVMGKAAVEAFGGIKEQFIAIENQGTSEEIRQQQLVDKLKNPPQYNSAGMATSNTTRGPSGPGGVRIR